MLESCVISEVIDMKDFNSALLVGGGVVADVAPGKRFIGLTMQEIVESDDGTNWTPVCVRRWNGKDVAAFLYSLRPDAERG